MKKPTKPANKKILKFRPISKKATILKYAIGASFILLPAILVAAFLYRSVEVVNFEGSSTLKPLVDEMAVKYLKQNGDVDINVQAGGSGSGLAKASSLRTDFGNYSEDVKGVATSEAYKNIWKENRLKTITLAWDGIALVYRAPTGCVHNMVLDSTNIEYLYNSFSGYNAQAVNGSTNSTTPFDYNLKSFIPNTPNECSTNLFPYARTGGAQRSGTAAAFLKDNKLLNLSNYQTKFPNEYKTLIDGTYGDQINVTQTSEANSAAWSIISSDRKIGSMIYLSMGFVIKNWQAIHDAGYKVASYKANGAQAVAINPNNYLTEVTKNYLWYRPLNTITSLLRPKDKGELFVNWMLQKEQNNIITNLGFIPLTEAQIQSMGYDKNDPKKMWEKSDVDLNVYGAVTKSPAENNKTKAT